MRIKLTLLASRVLINTSLSRERYNTSLDLACERKQVLVDDLGGLAVPLVLLRLLDVLVHLPLRLESLSTALIGAGEWSLFGVSHHVPLQVLRPFERCQAARVGAGEPWRRRVLATDVVLQAGGHRKSLTTTLFFADERPLAKMNSVVVALEVKASLEEEPTRDTLESTFTQMHLPHMPPHVSLLRERPLTADVSADVDFPKMKRPEVSTHGAHIKKLLVTCFFFASHFGPLCSI